MLAAQAVPILVCGFQVGWAPGSGPCHASQPCHVCAALPLHPVPCPRLLPLALSCPCNSTPTPHTPPHPSPCPLQCHTNVVAVFGELEDEPSLFPSTTNLAALADEAGGGGSGNGALPASASSSPSRPSTAAADGASQPPHSHPLLPPPPPESRYRSLPQLGRHFSLRRPKSLKLQGMVVVVIVASEWCDLCFL